jgi:hypothetical protein
LAADLEARARRAVVLAALVISCGQGVSLDPLAPVEVGDGGAGVGDAGAGGQTGDAGEAGGAVDASEDAADEGPIGDAGRPPCDPSMPFLTPVLVPGLNDAPYRQGWPRLSPDELEVYFVRVAPGRSDLDLYRATRSSVAEPFSVPVPLDELNTPFNELDASITGDGSKLLLESDRDTGYGTVYASTRSSPTGSFSSASRLDDIDQSAWTGGPYLLPQGGVFYFNSRVRGDDDIYRYSEADSPRVTLVSTINTFDQESFPVVTADELTIYFSSDRQDGDAKGAYDIWMATRASRDQAFDPPVNLHELNTPATDSATWISPDGCRLYVQRDIDNGQSVALYVVERSRSP